MIIGDKEKAKRKLTEIMFEIVLERLKQDPINFREYDKNKSKNK